MRRRIIYILLLFLTIFTISACEKDEENNFFEAEYNLTSATLNDEDITSDYISFTVNFYADGTMKVFINQNNLITSRNSTYTYDGGSNITETYSGKTYQYTIMDNFLITSITDFIGTTEIILTKVVVEETLAGVDFESELFGEDISLTKIYNYCPAIIMDTDNEGRKRMNIWYCTNKDSGIIVDYIGFRQGILNEHGRWEFGEEKIVLAPTENTWDARHTCDPTVVKGEFKLKDETYNYLMAYLGCTTEDYQKNETGIAVSKNIEGPWIKIDAVNPIVPWYDDGKIENEEGKYQAWQGSERIYWGTGMPSLLSVDGKGEVILFYQSTLRGTGIRRIDLSDLENPIVKYTVSIGHNGIYNSVNQNCNIGIPDFAYDPVMKRLYVVSVTNERNPADVTKTLVNSHSLVAYIDNLEDMEAVSETLRKGGYSWNMVGHVGPAETDWERNHNPGLVKTADAHIPNPDEIQVVVSTGKNSWANENIFTYRLHGWTFSLNN